MPFILNIRTLTGPPSWNLSEKHELLPKFHSTPVRAATDKVYKREIRKDEMLIDHIYAPPRGIMTAQLGLVPRSCKTKHRHRHQLARCITSDTTLACPVTCRRAYRESTSDTPMT